MQARELIDCLREIAPYVVIDCGSYIANDILSAVALMEADSILRLANCDPKSVNYFASQLPLLTGRVGHGQAVQGGIQCEALSGSGPHRQGAGRHGLVLPYSQELEEQYLAGNLLADLTLKDSRSFRKELERIIAEVF